MRVVACRKLCDIAQIPKPKDDGDDRRPDLSALSDKELEQLSRLLGKAAKAGGFPTSAKEHGEG